MPEYPQLLLRNQLCFPLYAISKEIVRRYEPLLTKRGLTYTQYIVFMALWEEDDVAVKSLGKCVKLDSGTLTPLLKKLEAKGLITRHADHDDERVTRIKLTEKGWALREECASIPYELGSCLNVSPEDALALKALLERVSKSLGGEL